MERREGGEMEVFVTASRSGAFSEWSSLPPSSGHLLPPAFVFDPEPGPTGLREQKPICGSPLWGEKSSGELESENSGVLPKKQCKECVNKGQMYATGCKGNEGRARPGETTGLSQLLWQRWLS